MLYNIPSKYCTVFITISKLGRTQWQFDTKKCLENEIGTFPSTSD